MIVRIGAHQLMILIVKTSFAVFFLEKDKVCRSDSGPDVIYNKGTLHWHNRWIDVDGEPGNYEPGYDDN